MSALYGGARCRRGACVVVFAGTLRLGTCAARPAVGAAAPYTVGRGGLIMKDRAAADRQYRRHRASRREHRPAAGAARSPGSGCSAQRTRPRPRVSKSLALMSGLTSLRRFIGADLVHAHGLKAGWLGIPIAWMFRVPLVDVAQRCAGRWTAPAAVRQTQRAVAADLTLGPAAISSLKAVRLGARNARLSPIAAPVLPAARSAATSSDGLSVLALRTRWYSRSAGWPPEEPGHGARHSRGCTRQA